MAFPRCSPTLSRSPRPCQPMYHCTVKTELLPQIFHPIDSNPISYSSTTIPISKIVFLAPLSEQRWNLFYKQPLYFFIPNETGLYKKERIILFPE